VKCVDDALGPSLHLKSHYWRFSQTRNYKSKSGKA